MKSILWWLVHSLLLVSVIWTVVEAEIIEFPGSIQFTTVPFKPMPTELIDNVEISGRTLWAEFLIKVNVVEFTMVGTDCWEVALEVPKRVISSSLPCLLTTVKLHLINSTETVHVRLSEFTTRHTGATIIGDNVTIPVHTKMM